LLIYLLRYDSYLSRYSTGQMIFYPTIVVDIKVCPVSFSTSTFSGNFVAKIYIHNSMIILV